MSSHLILIVEEDQATRAFLAEHQPQLVLADINGQTLGCSTPCAAPTGSLARSTPTRR